MGRKKNWNERFRKHREKKGGHLEYRNNTFRLSGQTESRNRMQSRCQQVKGLRLLFMTGADLLSGRGIARLEPMSRPRCADRILTSRSAMFFVREHCSPRLALISMTR